jgi:hypothetical protein
VTKRQLRTIAKRPSAMNISNILTMCIQIVSLLSGLSFGRDQPGAGVLAGLRCG